MYVFLLCEIDTWESTCVKREYDSIGKRHWFTKGFLNYSQKFCQQCFICAKHNAGRGIIMEQAAHSIPNKQFDHFQMDFIELTTFVSTALKQINEFLGFDLNTVSVLVYNLFKSTHS